MLKTGVEIIQSSKVEKSETIFPNFEFLLDNHTPKAMASRNRVGEKTMAVIKGLISESMK